MEVPWARDPVGCNENPEVIQTLLKAGANWDARAHDEARHGNQQDKEDPRLVRPRIIGKEGGPGLRITKSYLPFMGLLWKPGRPIAYLSLSNRGGRDDRQFSDGHSRERKKDAHARNHGSSRRGRGLLLHCQGRFRLDLRPVRNLIPSLLGKGSMTREQRDWMDRLVEENSQGERA